MKHASPRAIQLADYQPPEYLVDTIDLNFDLHEGETTVTATSRMRHNPAVSDADRGPLHLHGQELDLLSVKMDGETVHHSNFHTDAEHLVIHEVPREFELEVVTRIKPEENTSLEGLYRSSGNYCTQCEAEGFRKITYYPDRPDVMAVFSTRIEGDKERCPVLLSNGNPVESGDLQDGRHFVRWEDPFPKPRYLFALVAGNLLHIDDTFTTASGREVALKIYVEPQNIDRCEHAMESLKKAMTWDEEQYGREYDLDIYMIVAVNDFNMGAMENKGLNVFNSKYVLARPDTATDADYQGIEGVIAHEYFHNWTGNRITCRDWFQLSLKEGLTVYRDQEFSADMGSRGVKRIEDVRILRQHQFREDAGPMAHPVRPAAYIEINNFYTVTVYNKGAEVVRMQANLLGPEGYRKGTNLYFERHDGQAVTTDDFVRCMEDANGVDLTQFRRWYSQAGTPLVRVQGEYHADKREYVLSMVQSCAPTPGQEDKLPFHIPIAVGLIGKAGEDLPLMLKGEPEDAAGRGETTRVLALKAAPDAFIFTNVDAAPVASILRGFSAPVRVEMERSDEELMFLMAQDSDDFNRWDAGQILASRVIRELMAHRHCEKAMEVPQGYIDAFRAALLDEQADRDFLAELLRLPSEASLAEEMAAAGDTIDVAGIHIAREFLRNTLGREWEADFRAVYEACEDREAYDIEPRSIGRRALKNLCLGYLVRDEANANEGGANIAMAKAQYDAQANMTDVMAALGVLANMSADESDQALMHFHDQWRQDALVMDKWFALQAMSRREDTLDLVKTLMRHPAFDIRNPNKVRALIGAFCAGNPVRFHALDGSGYDFLADQVLALDPANPQVASRLLNNLTQWRKYDITRQELMRKQLERIVAVTSLSKDCYEVASKSLDA